MGKAVPIGLYHYRGCNTDKIGVAESYYIPTQNILGIYGQYTGRSRQGTMVIGNDTHHITKWDFDMTYGEVETNWTHSTSITTGASNRINVRERYNSLGKIHLLNVI